MKGQMSILDDLSLSTQHRTFKTYGNSMLQLERKLSEKSCELHGSNNLNQRDGFFLTRS